MAVTATYVGNVITLVPDGSADWDSSSLFPAGLRLGAVKFFPSAPTDILVMKHGSDAGPIITKIKDTVGGGAKDSFPNGLDCKPYFDQSACTFNVAANVIIILELV